MTPGTLRTSWLGFLIGAAVLALAGYGIFEARFLIEGPSISIEEPRDGVALAGPLLRISGSAKNIAFLSINGAQAFTDEEGRFDKMIAPPPGYTTVTVAGTDRFGRMEAKTARIVFVNHCSAYAEV